MKHMFAVYDVDAEEIVGPVWLLPSPAVAVRMFEDIARNPQSDVGKHPASFKLFQLGFIERMEVTLLPGWALLASADEFTRLAAGASLGVVADG